MKNFAEKITGLSFILIGVLFFAGCHPQVTVTKTDTVAPGPVTDLKAESAEGKITLTWTDPADLDLYGIKIYNGVESEARAAELTDGILVGAGIEKYEITNLTDGKAYTFEVSAVDKYLNESEKVSTDEVTFTAKTKTVEVVIEKKVYICSNDGKEYGTAQEAADCCGVQYKSVTKYICPKCGSEYETTGEAAGCCVVSAVTFTSEAAGDDGIKITMTCNTENAVIYYTTDKSVPDSSSTKYTAPVTFTEDTVIQAIAIVTKAEKVIASEITTAIVKIQTKTVEVEKIIYQTAIAADGTYTVYHCQQNVSGGNSFENYTLAETENELTIAKATTVESLKKTYGGFTVTAMAQNGSSVYIFYDRNQITYVFQSGENGVFTDGTTEKTVSGIYGAAVEVPSVTGSDYKFAGWKTEGGEQLKTKYGSENLTFIARWVEKTFDGYETPIDTVTGNKATKDSAYIYFGVFPKTVLPSDSTITVEDNELLNVTMGGNTYYCGSDKEYYAKITVNQDKTTYTYSDESTVTAGVVRYFKVEPIKWKVLTTNYNGTGNALLLAEDVIMSGVPFFMYYSTKDADGNVTYIKTRNFTTADNSAVTGIYRNNYQYSIMRAYLNGLSYFSYESNETKTYSSKGFLQAAFTTAAQGNIADTTIDNSDASTCDASNNYSCGNTKDKIFLLSRSELINSDYGFSTTNDADESKIRKATDYAKANKCNVSTESGNGSKWWSRSPSPASSSSDADNTYIYYVHNDGNTSNAEGCRASDYGIVPALTISLAQE